MEVIPQTTEHSFSAWERYNETQFKRTCECGAVEYEDHAWNDGEIITAATHLTEGEIKYTCQVCGTLKTEVIPKITEHTFGDWEDIDETQHRRTCECGEVEYDYHAWDDGEITTAATHLTEGEIKYTCQVCGTSKMEVIPKTPDHTFGAWEKHNETQYKRTCECGEVEYDYHAWDDGEITTVATHLTEGEIKYTCQVCGTSKTEVIPKNPEHTFGDWEKHDEVQHKRICECGEVEYDYHAWDDGEITTAATHLTEGEIKYTCKVCGTSKTEVIPKTPEHSFGEWEKHNETQYKRTCECGAVEYTDHTWYTKLRFPDINRDGAVDAYDASMILAAYAALMTGNDIGLTDEQFDDCDADRDGAVDAMDASLVLSYYSLASTGQYKATPEGWEEFMHDRVSLINTKTDE